LCGFKEMWKRIVRKVWQKCPPLLRYRLVRAAQRKFTVSVGAIILNEENRVLLLDHLLRPKFSWGIPGGFINASEQPVDAIKREIFEETGLELEDIQMFRVRTIYRHVEILYLARGRGTAEVKSREINALGWFAPEEMPAQMSSAHKQLIRQVLTNADIRC